MLDNEVRLKTISSATATTVDSIRPLSKPSTSGTIAAMQVMPQQEAKNTMQLRLRKGCRRLIRGNIYKREILRFLPRKIPTVR